MRPDELPTLGPGDRLPAFTLLPFRGERAVAWSPGRVTVVSFCALWCETWREQSARLSEVRRSLAGLPVEYRVVSVDGRWAERYGDGRDATGGVLLDQGGRLSSALGVRAVPWTFVVDRGGIIRLARQGIVRREEMETLLRRLASGGGSATGAGGPVYLTFDDFPAVREGQPVSEDEELLDVLRAARIPATFFCIGAHLTERAGADVARRAAREGHALQTHGWDHDARRPDLPRCARALTPLAGTPPTLYRPPGSSVLFRADGRTPAGPTRAVVNPYDFQRPGPPELTRRVLFAVRPGAVIQLHAGVRETRDALPGVIEALQRRGLRFARLDG